MRGTPCTTKTHSPQNISIYSEGGEELLSRFRRLEYQIALLNNDNSSRSRQLEDLQDDNQYLNKQHDSTSRRIEELEDDNKYVKRQLQLARPSQRTAALLSCRAADHLLKRITPEMIQRATLDVSQDSRNEKNSAAHNIDVETAIEI